jgi:putative tryptophan/tyrosine transport system substrate-binding protein
MNRTTTGMSRRRVVLGAGAVGLGLLAGCGRLPWQAAAPTRLPRIGVLAAVAGPWDGLREGLQELGYVEGKNLIIEWRSAEGDNTRLPLLATELIQWNPDVIVAAPAAGAVATYQGTKTIPIVMVNVPNPVELGLVQSIPKPGGNVTGVASINEIVEEKRVELLHDMLGAASRIAVIIHPENPAHALYRQGSEHAAGRLGIELRFVPVRHESDLASAFADLKHGTTSGLIIYPDATTVQHRARIVQLVAATSLPAVYALREFVDVGGLASYGADLPGMFREAAGYVHKILNGAKPADLPVQQPMRFQLIINLKAAQALGLTIPPHVLLQATEVIQ